MVDIPDLQPHPFSLIFAAQSEDSVEYEKLMINIGEIGLQNPIMLYQGKILAGNTRYAILKHYAETDNPVEAKFEHFAYNDDDKALDFAINDNIARRHLNESERGMAAARLYKLVNPNRKNKAATEDIAARRLNVGKRMVEYALKLIDSEREDLVGAVDIGKLKLTNAVGLLNVPKVTVENILETDNANRSAQTQINAAHHQERVARMVNGAIRQTNADQSKRYGVIYADPPWTFETWSEEGEKKSAKNHYRTLTLDEIKSIQIPSANDCALFLWTTIPHLQQALEVMNAWGFEYRSAYGWKKTKIGTGYWSRNNLELILLGIKGDVPAPLKENISNQCLEVAQGKHSEKPEAFASMITKMFPDIPKAEFFARRTEDRDNTWDYYGDEVGVELEVSHDESKPKRNGNGKRKKKEESSVVSSDSEQEGLDAPAEQQGKMDTEDTIVGTD